MTNDEISEFQFYLQMYDKGMVSKKTVLEKIGIDSKEESKQIKKEYDAMHQEFSSANMPGSVGGSVGGVMGGEMGGLGLAHQ